MTDLTAREQELMERYTEQRVTPGEGNVDLYTPVLKIGNQRFYLGLEATEDTEEIAWFRAMLGKALAQLLELEKQSDERLENAAL